MGCSPEASDTMVVEPRWFKCMKYAAPSMYLAIGRPFRLKQKFRQETVIAHFANCVRQLTDMRQPRFISTAAQLIRPTDSASMLLTVGRQESNPGSILSEIAIFLHSRGDH